MADFLLPYEKAEAFCLDAFARFGFSPEECRIITDITLLADLYGIESHGLQRLGRYHRAIESGTIKVSAHPEIVFETPVSAVMDGHDGMGQVCGHAAMELAIQKAKTSGIGMVTMRNSNHFGIAGYYVNMALSENLVGLCLTNTAGIMVPTFGKKALLGSNPIAVGFPADPHPFLFDAATTVVTRGKLEVYNKADKPLPIGWALDASGHDTDDADDVLNNIIHKNGGGIVPIGGSNELSGGHKGYGLSMLVEIFTAVLSLGATSGQTYDNGKGGVCHFFLAMDPALFGDPDAIRARLNRFLDDLRTSPKADGQDRIFIPGEKEFEQVAVKRKNGLPAAQKTIDEMHAIADTFQMDFDAYFG